MDDAVPLLEIWHKLIIVVAQQVVLEIRVGSNAFQFFKDWKGVNNFPPLGLSLSERRNVRRRYQHGDKMEHDEYLGMVICKMYCDWAPTISTMAKHGGYYYIELPELNTNENENE